jgi:Cu2+-exporting ATPase
LEKANKIASEGKTPIFFAKGKQVLGIIAVADKIKTDSAKAIEELKRMGIRTVMLTGDNKLSAETIAKQVGIEEVLAELKPEQKEKAIVNLQKEGKVAMVGDGINDAPSLTRADIGIAIGAGTDVAIDAADIVLVNSNLSDVGAAIRLSRATLKIIRENLFWAFIYNVICIPVAAGAFVWAGLTLNPMIGAAAMSLSSFCVVTNALRLNFFDVRKMK